MKVTVVVDAGQVGAIAKDAKDLFKNDRVDIPRTRRYSGNGRLGPRSRPFGRAIGLEFDIDDLPDIDRD